MKLVQKLVLPLLASTALFVQGCAVQPQNVPLDPTVQVPESKTGQGKTVQVEVKDARPRKTLGVVGDLSGKWAHVSIENDLTNPVYQSVAAGLLKQGFMVQPTPTADGRKLEVEVREIDYESLREGFLYETKAKAAIAAKATNGESTYERIYEAGRTLPSRPTVPSAKDNVSEVNSVVGATIEDMLKDDKITAVLAR